MIDDARQKKFEAVIVSSLDRFGRSILDILNNVKALDGLKVNFISIKQNVDVTNPYGRLLFHVLAALAELEREMIEERMGGGRKAKLRDHRSRSGQDPYECVWVVSQQSTFLIKYPIHWFNVEKGNSGPGMQIDSTLIPIPL